MEDLSTLAALIKAKNMRGQDISDVLQRPAQIGHAGEYIASRIFGIELELKRHLIPAAIADQAGTPQRRRWSPRLVATATSRSGAC
jgi:hypothetical protein